MTLIFAIDPGPTRSAWLFLRDGQPSNFAIEDNDSLLERLREAGTWPTAEHYTVVIEQVRSMGMSVGAEVFDTVHWSGRFHEAARPSPVALLPRHKVKTHLCGSQRAKDGNIRQALIDRFGGSTAIGRKATPGPLYGISSDVWQALALAVTYADTAE